MTAQHCECSAKPRSGVQILSIVCVCLRASDFQDAKHFINKSYFFCLPQDLRSCLPSGLVSTSHAQMFRRIIVICGISYWVFFVSQSVFPSLLTTLCAKISCGLFVLQLLSYVQPGPGTHPAFSTIGIWSFQGAKGPGSEVHIPLHLAPKLKKEYR